MFCGVKFDMIYPCIEAQKNVQGIQLLTDWVMNVMILDL